jgi:hypothetical protein
MCRRALRFNDEACRAFACGIQAISGVSWRIILLYYRQIAAIPLMTIAGVAVHGTVLA